MNTHRAWILSFLVIGAFALVAAGPFYSGWDIRGRQVYAPDLINIYLPIVMRNAGNQPTPTSTLSGPTATNTPVPPTATNTPVPPTATNTPVPPTATNTPVFPVLQNANFELGHVAWTEDSLFFPGDQILQQGTGGAPIAHDGTWLAWLGGVDNETADLSQQVTFPSGIGPTYLNFYYQMSSDETNCNPNAPSDVINLDINNTFATGFIVCNAYNTGATWVPLGFPYDLSVYAGQTVTLHIKVITDAALTSSVYFDTFSFNYAAADRKQASQPLPSLQVGHLQQSP